MVCQILPNPYHPIPVWKLTNYQRPSTSLPTSTTICTLSASLAGLKTLHWSIQTSQSEIVPEHARTQLDLLGQMRLIRYVWYKYSIVCRILCNLLVQIRFHESNLPNSNSVWNNIIRPAQSQQERKHDKSTCPPAISMAVCPKQRETSAFPTKRNTCSGQHGFADGWQFCRTIPYVHLFGVSFPTITPYSYQWLAFLQQTLQRTELPTPKSGPRPWSTKERQHGQYRNLPRQPRSDTAGSITGMPSRDATWCNRLGMPFSRSQGRYFKQHGCYA